MDSEQKSDTRRTESRGDQTLPCQGCTSLTMQLNFCQGNCQSLRDELSMKDEKLRTAHKEFHFDQELNRKLVVWLKQCLTRQGNELSRLNKVNRYLQGKMRVYYQPSGSPMKGDANRRLRLHLSFRSSELEEVALASSRTRKNKNEGGGRGSAIATHMKLEKTKAHSMADKEIQVAFRNEKAEFGQPMQGIDKNNPSDGNKRHLKDTDEPTKCCNDVHTQTQPISNERWTERFKNLKSENDGFTSEIQNLKKIARRLETQLEEKELELKTQGEQLEDIQRQLDSEKRDHALCQASVEASIVRQDALDAHRVQLEWRIEQFSNTVRECQLELNTARECLNQHDRRFTEQTKKLERQTQCVEQLNKEKTEFGQPMQGIDKNNPPDANKRHLKDLDEPMKYFNHVHKQTQPISEELWKKSFENLKSEKDGFISEIHNLTERVRQFETQLDEKERKLNTQREQLEDLQRQLDSGFTSEIQNLKKIARRLEKQLEEKELELKTQGEQLEDLQRQLDSEKRENARSQASVEASVRQEAAMVAQRAQLERQIEQRSNTVRERQLELNTAVERLNQHDRRFTEQTKKLERQTQCVEQLNEEKTELLNRLSKLASSALTDGNPATCIPDLSDKKRPTKLAEIYSELYDNEWKEAYDEQEKRFNRKENDIIEDLLYLIMTTHHTCHVVSAQYLERMTDAASRYPEENTMFFKKCGPGGDAPVELRKMIRDIRNVASPYIQLKIKQALDNEWKQRNVRVEQSTHAYIDKCLQLCWDMSVKDPPVVLTSLPAVGSDYEKDKYRFYTESGSTVGYTVWPGMLLHEGGPTLVKGVVQGMDLT